MVLTFTVAQGDQRFSSNVNLTHDISMARCGRPAVTNYDCDRVCARVYVWDLSCQSDS